MTQFQILKDAAGVPLSPSVFLAYRDLSLIGVLHVEDLTVRASLSAADEISFNVHKYEDGVLSPLWDRVTDLQLVFVREWRTYFEITVQIDETDETVKKVTGQSLCESELGQIILYDLELNTESDILRDDYKKPSVFYDADDPENSMLHRILEKAPHYTIAHVDNHLQTLVRSFSANETSIYDFLTSTVAEELNCLFVFDSTQRSISVYDLENYCVDCMDRIGQAETCPVCGGSDIVRGYGEDTTIFVAAENLSDSLSRASDPASVKNCFRLEAGDDYMTATIANINPNGTRYIYRFSPEQKALMPSELVEKLEAYDQLYQSKQEPYAELNEQWYDLIDEILYKQTSMMPTSGDSGTTAQQELNKLTPQNLSPVAVSNFSTAAKTTVDNAVLAYAKVYVRGTYKVEITHSTYSSPTWTGAFRVTSYADEEDTATSAADIQITVNGDEEKFIQQRIEKALAQDDVEDKDYDWTQYSLDMLSSYENAYMSAIDVLIEMGVSEKTHEFYQSIYVPYYEELEAIRAEMVVREQEIAELEEDKAAVEAQKRAINEDLDIQAYLGEELWKVLYSYRREQTYSNDNYISDGLSNSEVIEKAREFFTAAQKELITASTVQYSLSCSMYNLLVRPEFQALWSKFKLGNWLRMKINHEIHRMRLVQFQVNFERIETLTVEFSDATRTSDGLNDVQSILDKAQSMATSYEYVAHQASKGTEANTFLENWFQNGLDMTAVKLVNNAQNQSVVSDGHGILVRRYDDEQADYANEQTKLINAGLYITSDNWRSSETAIGRFYFRDPKTEEIKEAYGVNARVVAGQLILGESMQITNAANSVTIDEDGFRVANGLNAFVVDPSTHNMVQIQKLNTEGEFVPQMYIDSNGVLHFSDGTAIGAGSVIEGGVSIDLDNVTVPVKDEQGQTTNKTFSEFLDVDVANIINLQADSAIINALKTHYLDAGAVNADLANIKSIMSGNIGTGSLTTITLTAENVNIDDAVIQDLIAKKITTLDLTSGSINTTNFTIQSDDGQEGLKIVGNTLQMYDDEGNVGVQLGYGENGKPSLILKDDAGNVMLDSTGLHESIVPDQFIKTDMVADKAITGGKIDWTDISESVDEEGNPVWNAASVKLDGEGLDIKFQQTTDEINSLSGKIDSVRIVGKNCFTKNEGGVLEPETIVLRAEKKNNATVNRWLIDDVEVTATTESELYPWIGTGAMTLTIPRDYMTTRQSITVTLKGTSSAENANEDLTDIMVVYRVQDGQDGAPGQPGEPGQPGANGVSVSSVVVQYYLSTSPTELTGGEWSSQAPTWEEGKYMWSKTVTTLLDSDGEPISPAQESDPVCITGNKGADGAPGEPGAAGTPGRGVVSITPLYAMSQDKTTAPELTEFSETPPTWESGYYIWTCNKIIYSDALDDPEYTTPYCDSTIDAVNGIDEDLDEIRQQMSLNEALAMAGSCALLFADYDFALGFNEVKPYNTLSEDLVEEEGVLTIGNVRVVRAYSSTNIPETQSDDTETGSEAGSGESGETDSGEGSDTGTDTGTEGDSTIDEPIKNMPTRSGYGLRVMTVGSAAPNWGGIQQSIPARANATFVIRYLIALPPECTLVANNSGIGEGGQDYWLTDTKGVGAWKEYVRVVQCGETGDFGGTGAVSVQSTMTSYTEDNPLVWYIASIRAADLAYTVDIHTEIESSQQVTVDQIASSVQEAITVQVTDEDGNVENVSLQDYVAQQQIVSDAIRQEVESATTYYEEDEDGNLVPVKYESLASSFNQFANSMTLNFENLSQSTDGKFDEISSYIRFGDGSTNNPQIQLGKVSSSDNSQITLNLNNDQIWMANSSGQKLTWWTTNAFNATNGVFEDKLQVTNQLTIGSYAWIKGTHSSYDSLTLMHV